jgi:hypothetical protein
MRRPAALVAAMLALAMGAQGHYQFVRYLSRSAPWTPVYERFDLDSLQNKTVPFLISDQTPALSAGDTVSGLVSQIRLAARAWNDVPSSDLRLAFGGFFTPGATSSTPMIEVVFDELPPGVLAKGGPTIKADPTDLGNGVFTPILKSTMILPVSSDRPSWAEDAFLTIVHEMGHCLGLQHTLTSSVMSTSITRGTTKAQPLGPDDVAGLATLYPVRGAAVTTGSITGRVTLSGTGVNLASVVALSLDGAGISALTKPDGSYRIEGVPAGTYYVYAHPLPPMIAGESFDAGITPPRDLDGRFLNATTSFETQFFPGTKDANRAQAVAVDAGGSVDGVNFAVTRRAAPAVFGVQTYSFPAQIAVHPAHLTTSGGRSFVVASGYGLSAKAAVGVVGGSAIIPTDGVKPYPQDNRFVQMDLQFNIASSTGIRHLTFTLDNDLYVLPAAFRLTQKPPPSISSAVTSLDATGTRVVIIAGTNLTADTQILFNGVAAQVRNFDEFNGSMSVIPPPGMPGETARIVALNRDGQSSLFVQQASVYELESLDPGSFAVNPAALPAGTESVLEVTGNSGSFSQAYTSIAFGSSAIQVRRVFVTGPNRMLVNVAVAPNAAPGLSTVTLTNGLRLQNLPGGFQVTPGSPRVSVLRGPIVDAATGKTEISAGGSAQVRITGPLADVPNVTVTVGDRAATRVSNSAGLLSFVLPAGLTPGAAIVQVSSGSDISLPLAIGVDQPPPTVNFASISGTRVDALRPARPGELVTVNVSGMAEAGTAVANSRVVVIVGISQHAAVQITPSGTSHNVQFVLDPFMGTGPQPLSVSIDGRVSPQVPFPVRAN